MWIIVAPMPRKHAKKNNGTSISGGKRKLNDKYEAINMSVQFISLFGSHRTTRDIVYF